MARAKTLEQTVENLRSSSGLIGARYTTGINNASWQQAAASDQAETNYGQGVQMAVANGTRRAGILRVSDADWRTAAITKGAAVIGQRIVDALPKYRANFAPILAAMSSAAEALPARTTSATQNVQNRLLPIIAAAQTAAGKTPN